MLPLFLAKRIYGSEGDGHQVSRPAIRIATIGVAIGIAVMIITVSVILGFKHTIRDKIVGFGSHIQVTSYAAQQTAIPVPISLTKQEIQQLRHLPNVRHIERYVLTQGILKTDSDFLGVAFKGIDQHYDLTFLRQCMVEGDLPVFNDTKSSNKLVISRQIANTLHLKVGQKVFAYFIAYDDVRVRRFTICGIYQSNMKQFDDVLCITDLRTTLKLNEWADDQMSGIELQIRYFELLDETSQQVTEIVKNQTDSYGETLTSQTIYEAYPQVFSWLSLLDINVRIILALMIAVAGFTMISGLLIIILERTQMIGLLKALGARNRTVRHTFLSFAVFIIGQGLLAGNIIGLGLVLLQQHYGIVKLDPTTYYVSTAPVEISIPLVVLLNVATLLLSIFVLLAPSHLVSRIHPAKAIRFE